MNTEQSMLMSIYVNELLSPLSPEQRRAMMLHSGGLTYQQLAAEMGLPYWRVKRLIAQGLSKTRESFGISLPTQSDNVADAWWPLVLESLRREANVSHSTADDGQLIFGQNADLGGNAPEDHGSGALNDF
jgi:hypothetical protein